MPPPELVDDTDHIVQYQGGWLWDQSARNEVRGTRHGCPAPQITASLAFYGTGIEVYGTVEPTEINGRPSALFSVDRRDISTYTAPFVPNGGTRLNVTYFSKRDLARGNHQVMITNLNGTAPNMFWLDFFLVYDEDTPPATDNGIVKPPPTRTSTSTTSTRSTTTNPAENKPTNPPTTTKPSSTRTETSSAGPDSDSSSSSGSSSLSTDVSASGIPSATESQSSSTSDQDQVPYLTVTETSPPEITSISAGVQPSAAASSESDTNIGAIIGGVVGGLALIVLLLIAFLLRRRRQSMARADKPPMTQYTVESSLSSAAVVPSAAYMHHSAAAGGDVSGHPPPDGRSSSSAYTMLSGNSSAQLTATPAGMSKEAEAAYHHTSYLSGSSTDRLVRRDTMLTSPSEMTTPPLTPLMHEEVSHARWYAPTGLQARAQALLHAFTPARDASEGQPRTPVRDVDSGLRMYDHETLPPAYTPD